MRYSRDKLLVLCLVSLAPALGAADSDGGDPVRGAERWAETCVRCHNLRQPSEYEAKLWKVSLTHMRIRAGLTGKDAADIAAFMINASPDKNQVFQVVTERPGTGPAPAAGASSPTIDGASLYQSSTCITCHGERGTGVLPGVPDLTAEDSPLVAKSKEELAKNIERGFQTPGSIMAMPPKGGDPSLSLADVQALLNYLMDTFRTP